MEVSGSGSPRGSCSFLWTHLPVGCDLVVCLVGHVLLVKLLLIHEETTSPQGMAAGWGGGVPVLLLRLLPGASAPGSTPQQLRRLESEAGLRLTRRAAGFGTELPHSRERTERAGWLPLAPSTESSRELLWHDK